MQTDNEVARVPREALVHQVARLEGHRGIELPRRLDERTIDIESERGHAERSLQLGGEVALAAAHINHAPHARCAATEPRRERAEECVHLLRLLEALTPRATAAAAAAAQAHGSSDERDGGG